MYLHNQIATGPFLTLSYIQVHKEALPVHDHMPLITYDSHRASAILFASGFNVWLIKYNQAEISSWSITVPTQVILLAMHQYKEKKTILYIDDTLSLNTTSILNQSSSSPPERICSFSCNIRSMVVVDSPLDGYNLLLATSLNSIQLIASYAIDDKKILEIMHPFQSLNYNAMIGQKIDTEMLQFAINDDYAILTHRYCKQLQFIYFKKDVYNISISMDHQNILMLHQNSYISIYNRPTQLADTHKVEYHIHIRKAQYCCEDKFIAATLDNMDVLIINANFQPYFILTDINSIPLTINLQCFNYGISLLNTPLQQSEVYEATMALANGYIVSVRTNESSINWITKKFNQIPRYSIDSKQAKISSAGMMICISHSKFAVFTTVNNEIVIYTVEQKTNSNYIANIKKPTNKENKILLLKDTKNSKLKSKRSSFLSESQIPISMPIEKEPPKLHRATSAKQVNLTTKSKLVINKRFDSIKEEDDKCRYSPKPKAMKGAESIIVTTPNENSAYNEMISRAVNDAEIELVSDRDKLNINYEYKIQDEKYEIHSERLDQMKARLQKITKNQSIQIKKAKPKIKQKLANITATDAIMEYPKESKEKHIIASDAVVGYTKEIKEKHIIVSDDEGHTNASKEKHITASDDVIGHTKMSKEKRITSTDAIVELPKNSKEKYITASDAVVGNTKESKDKHIAATDAVVVYTEESKEKPSLNIQIVNEEIKKPPKTQIALRPVKSHKQINKSTPKAMQADSDKTQSTNSTKQSSNSRNLALLVSAKTPGSMLEPGSHTSRKKMKHPLPIYRNKGITIEKMEEQSQINTINASLAKLEELLILGKIQSAKFESKSKFTNALTVIPVNGLTPGDISFASRYVPSTTSESLVDQFKRQFSIDKLIKDVSFTNVGRVPRRIEDSEMLMKESSHLRPYMSYRATSVVHKM